MNIDTIGTHTEIYVGGGKYLTQSYPTNFHTFHTRRILNDNETPTDYIEVTEAERAAIQARDAAWQRPSQWVIDMFNADPNGRYNEATGYGELNGLTDLTARQMETIVRWGNKLLNHTFSTLGGLPIQQDRHYIRTNLTPLNGDNLSLDSWDLFAGQSELEVVRLSAQYMSWGKLIIKNVWAAGFFGDCRKLREVIGAIDVSYATGCDRSFSNCVALEEVRLYGLKCDFSFNWSPKLSLESIRYLVNNAANTKAITVTVHADVYAKLTDETNEDWHSILITALDKNINFATT